MEAHATLSSPDTVQEAAVRAGLQHHLGHHRRDHRLHRRPLDRGQDRRQRRRPDRYRPGRRRHLPGDARGDVRLPRRTRLLQLPAEPHGRPAGDAARARGAGPVALLPPLHRPQGGRDPVPGRGPLLLLRRRVQRDDDPRRAHQRQRDPHRLGQLPHPRRPPRHDDADDDVGRGARAARQLPHPADDWRPADGVSADRGAHAVADGAGRRRAAVGDRARRLPHRLDRLRAAV